MFVPIEVLLGRRMVLTRELQGDALLHRSANRWQCLWGKGDGLIVVIIIDLGAHCRNRRERARPLSLHSIRRRRRQRVRVHLVLVPVIHDREIRNVLKAGREQSARCYRRSHRLIGVRRLHRISKLNLQSLQPLGLRVVDPVLDRPDFISFEIKIISLLMYLVLNT